MSLRDVGVSENRETNMRPVVGDFETCWIGMWARDGGLEFGDDRRDRNGHLVS